MNGLTAEEARRLFSYDKETGALTRLVSTGRRGLAGSQCTAPHGEGYYHVKINRKSHLVHRLAWLIVTGAFPPNTIDHINQIRHDNRWCNLRLADKTQQNGNCKARKSETGVRGVRKQCGKFRAVINMTHPKDGKPGVRHLGTFQTIEEAKAAYDAAASAYFGEYYKIDTARRALEGK